MKATPPRLPGLRSARATLLAALLATLLTPALLVGCTDYIEEGTLVGSLVVPDCEGGEGARFTCLDTALEDCDAFRLDIDFFALDFLGDAARLSLQQGGRPFGLADGLTFQIADVRQLRGRLGQSIPVGPNANVRAALGLFDRCPDTTQNFTLTGAVTFTRFGVERGDRVTGTIDRLEVRDGRPTDGSAGPVLGLLRGDFDFILRVGPPYQRFTR